MKRGRKRGIRMRDEYRGTYFELIANLDHHDLLSSDEWIALVEFVVEGERVVRLELKESLVYAFRQPGQARAAPNSSQTVVQIPNQGVD